MYRFARVNDIAALVRDQCEPHFQALSRQANWNVKKQFHQLLSAVGFGPVYPQGWQQQAPQVWRHANICIGILLRNFPLCSSNNISRALRTGF